MTNISQKILNLFKNSSSGPQEKQEENQTKVAAAVILLEAAHADDNCTAEELAHIRETIKESFAISSADAEKVIELAAQARADEVDLWQFTNEINTSLDLPRKLEIIEAVWEIIYSDGRLESHEDHFAHKMARLLRLSHQQLIDAKMRVKRGNK